jgi:hypothetical protein
MGKHKFIDFWFLYTAVRLLIEQNQLVVRAW